MTRKLRRNTKAINISAGVAALKNGTMSFVTNSAMRLFSALAIMSVLFVGTSCEDDNKPTPAEHTITSFVEIGQEGGTIEIVGTNFLTDKTKITVTFVGAATNNQDDKVVSADDFVSATATKLTVKVPDAAQSGKISVKQNGQTVTTTEDFTVSEAITITELSPATVAKTGTLEITGTNFLTSEDDIVITFLGADGDTDDQVVPAEDVTATATKLTVTVPADAITGKVKVMQLGFLAVESTNNATVVDAHTVTQPAGAATTEQAFTIEGTNFSTTADDITVLFTKDGGTTEATVTAATATTITVTVPADAITGAVSVEQFGLTVATGSDVTVN